MKKTFMGIAIAAVAVIALGVAGWAYAQSPAGTAYTGMMNGGWNGRTGGMGGYGMMGTGQNGMGGYGMMGENADMEALHEYMLPAMASALGLTPEAFEARLEAGETFWDIAEAQGLTQEESWGLMQAARDTALQQAVEDGVIDEAFAAWMLEHAGRMYGDGDWAGGGHCGDAEFPMRSGNDF